MMLNLGQTQPCPTLPLWVLQILSHLTWVFLREGTPAHIMNTVVVGFNDAGLDIDNSATWTQANAENLLLNHFIWPMPRTLKMMMMTLKFRRLCRRHL